MIGSDSVAMAWLSPLMAQLKQLSNFCGSDSWAEPISVTPEWLSHPNIVLISWLWWLCVAVMLAACPTLLPLPFHHPLYTTLYSFVLCCYLVYGTFVTQSKHVFDFLSLVISWTNVSSYFPIKLCTNLGNSYAGHHTSVSSPPKGMWDVHG